LINQSHSGKDQISINEIIFHRNCAMRSLLIFAVLLSGVSALPAVAQSDPVSLRVGKLEKEMKAVQRKVFPNGVAIEPEIGGSTASVAGGTPANTPVADLTARVDALESSLRTLTGQVETDGNRIKKLEDAVKAMRSDFDTRLKALEPQQTAEVPAPKPIESTAAAAVKPPAVVPKPASPVTKPVVAPAKPTPAAKPDAARKAAIAAVEVPSTGDAAEDTYAYAYRLWAAKLYPEAQVKLKEFMAKYQSHKKASFAQNLLGRAYLDEGKPALASVAFYDNYQKMPRGERANESLYWLGISLMKLKKPADACKVYKEFDDVYAGKSGPDLRAKVGKGKADAKCPA
jgi:TolA-binding protein